MTVRTCSLLAVATTGLMAVSLLTAPAASAYPPGKEQRTTLNRTDVRSEGRFKAQVRNAQPGCRVKFEVKDSRGKVVESRVGTVGRDGTDQREFSPAPRRVGTYKVVAKISGGGCLAAKSEATLTVRPR